MILPFTVQIPVFNETKALEFSIFYFDRLGVPARYVLDAQCTSETAATLRSLGREQCFFANDKPFIENGYENFAALSPTDWILRIDCDEVPSRELIDACCDFVRDNRYGVAGFERHQVLWRDNRLLTATADRFAPSAQRQWRLFNRKQVKFNQTIHTSGIQFENSVAMAPEATLYHLLPGFLTWEDRLKKAARHDQYGQVPSNRTSQLFPIEDANWTELNAPFLLRVFSEWGR